MATRNLIEKIEALPPEKVAEVEDFVAFLASRDARAAAKTFPDELLKRIDERRERLLRERGLFPDSAKIIRELRDGND